MYIYIYVCILTINSLSIIIIEGIYCTRKYYILHKRLDNGRNVRMVCMSPCIDIPGDQ